MKTKTKTHRNDEPTILPSDCAAIVFKPDGSLEMFFAKGKGDDDPISDGTYQVMRAAILFGTGPDCDEVRRIVDAMIERGVEKRRPR